MSGFTPSIETRRVRAVAQFPSLSLTRPPGGPVSWKGAGEPPAVRSRRPPPGGTRQGDLTLRVEAPFREEDDRFEIDLRRGRLVHDERAKKAASHLQGWIGAEQRTVDLETGVVRLENDLTRGGGRDGCIAERAETQLVSGTPGAGKGERGRFAQCVLEGDLQPSARLGPQQRAWGLRRCSRARA